MAFDADLASTHNPSVGGKPTAAWGDKINDNFAAIGGAWTAYTPTFSGTIGNGVLSGAYVKIGRTVWFRAGVSWGSTTSHAAAVQTLTLPATAASSQIVFGTVNVNQGGTARWMHAALITTTTVSGKLQDDSGITNVLPVAAWANGHYWSVTGFYEAAS